MGAFTHVISRYCSVADTILPPFLSQDTVDSLIREDAELVMYWAFPFAKIFLKHFMSGTGKNLIIPIAGITENDNGVKKNIIGYLEKEIHKLSGNISTPQSKYEDKNYQMALGSLNFQWKVVTGECLANGDDISIIDLWFYNTYQWNSSEKRVSQCMHRAFSNSNGVEFDMIGKRAFYRFKLTAKGKGELLYLNQNSDKLKKLREANPPAHHTGIDIITLYPEAEKYLMLKKQP
jgi:hypothetical protein